MSPSKDSPIPGKPAAGGSAADHRPLNAADRGLFYFTASVTGATVMMIELLGTRIIGPFYGVSMIVWSSLLSTALFALSIGYLLGGRLADTEPRLRLSHILLFTGVLIAVIPLLSKPVQLATDGLGLRWGALSSALILFAPCLIGLGMVGPYVIKITTRGIERAGRTAGTVYAISTLGSVFGTILLGFYLLPIFGTVSIVLSLSVLLLILALALATYEKLRLGARLSLPLWVAVVAALVAGVVFGVGGRAGARDYPGSIVVFEQETPYGWVRVVDQPELGVRWLMSGGSTIGAEDLASGRGLFDYLQVAGLLPLFNVDGKSALLVGLGAGHLVNLYNRSGIVTDSIEIDPAVAHAANHYFSFEGSGEVWVADARYQIRKIDRQYDFIIHDTFTGGSEPIHLMSREMFIQLKARLKPGGVMVLNMVGFNIDGGRQPVEAVARTLDSVFPHRRSFVSEPGETFNDFLFFVSDEPLVLDKSPRFREAVDWLLEREVVVEGGKGRLITDDFNPLETLNIRKAETYRQLLIDRIGRDLLFH
ncbi:MAG: fused MFS/spermidine synthase [Opitutales bacterium]|nr:fused MFS/spermidine synthase [Opitutales bacterium]